MKKLNVLVMGLLLPLLAAAQTIKSPNGNVIVPHGFYGFASGRAPSGVPALWFLL